MECASCQHEADATRVPRWKAPLLFVGTLFFCPCHLPATFGVLAAAGAGVTGAGWLLTHRGAVYAAFGLLYFVFLGFFLRWVVRSRDAEKRYEALHQRHVQQT